MAITYLKKSPKTSSTDDTKTTGIVQDLLKNIETTKEQGCIDLTKKFDKYDGDIIVSKERIEEMECFLQEEPYWQKMVEGNKGQEFLLEYVQAKAIFEKEFLEKNSGKLMDSLSTEVMEQEFENSYE